MAWKTCPDFDGTTVSVIITIADSRLPPGFLVSSFSASPQVASEVIFTLKKNVTRFVWSRIFFFL